MHNQGNKKAANAQEDFSGGGAAIFKTVVKPSANIIGVRKRGILERESFIFGSTMKKGEWKRPAILAGRHPDEAKPKKL